VTDVRFIEGQEASVPRYLVTYVGGGMPYDPELMAQARAAFGERLPESGDAVTEITEMPGRGHALTIDSG
jgi:hypothetical protein